MAARIFQVNVSRGGVPKLPVMEAEVTAEGIVGDKHNEPITVHGGPERALCLFSLELLERLQAEGHPIYPGSAGENVTITGLDWDTMTTGARLRLGSDVVIEITRDTTPCRTIAGSFKDRQYGRISQKLNPGWSRVYARVVTEGTIRPGDAVEMC